MTWKVTMFILKCVLTFCKTFNK